MTSSEAIQAELKIVLGNTPKRAVKSRQRLVWCIERLDSIIAFSKKMRHKHNIGR